MYSLLKSQLNYFQKPQVDKRHWRQKLWRRMFKRSNTLSENEQGQVVFVGAGTGDPDLLTIKAVKALRQADVVLVDWLVSPKINALISPKAERIFVGKKCGEHSMAQSDINMLLLRKAKSNKLVVRLKGGDPSVFARLPEETQILSNHNIRFQIVPGITAASGCAAYTGIPLTHRDCSQSVKLITAHTKKGGSANDWAYLAKDKGTLVFYMGLNELTNIASKLVEHGMSANKPIAIVDEGTTDNQRLFVGALDCINSGNLDITTLKGPVLIIVGDVVSNRVEVERLIVQNRTNHRYASVIG